MDTIVIQYLEQTKDLASGTYTLTPLGKETLESISEALLPDHGKHPVFCVKKFSNNANYRWHVEGVARVSPAASKPAIYTVTLSKLFSSNVPEEYLRQTLDKTQQSLESLIRRGTLVDVDYGFIQSIAREDGEMRTNKRYCDTLQKGEMHKRRLAVVVRATRGIVQVAPVTSQAPPPTDKTCFKLSPNTMSHLAQWGASGKDSWVLTGMIETVSPCRILPPMTTRTKGNGRSPHYSLRLSSHEDAEMKVCLSHSVGINDYQLTKAKLAEAREDQKALQKLMAEVGALHVSLAALQHENRELQLVKEVAVDWSKQQGGTQILDFKVAELKTLYADMEAEEVAQAAAKASAG